MQIDFKKFKFTIFEHEFAIYLSFLKIKFFSQFIIGMTNLTQTTD